MSSLLHIHIVGGFYSYPYTSKEVVIALLMGFWEWTKRMHLWRLNNVKGVMFVYLGCEAFMQIGVVTSRPDC